MSEQTAFTHLLEASKPYPRLQGFIAGKGPIWYPPERKAENSQLYLARSIVGQQLSVKAAQTIWGRVNEAAMTRNCSTLDLFTQDHAELLRACGLSGSKTKAVCAIHEHYTSENLTDEALSEMGHESRSASLTRIWGVGQWTVDMVSIFFFRDPDIWAPADNGLLRAVERVTGAGLPDKKQFAAFGESFKPWRSILSLYLWRVLDQKEIL